MQSNLSNNLMVFIFVAINGCSTSPPMLPPDYGSVNPTHTINESMFVAADLKKTCREIDDEHRELEQILYKIDKDIEDDRTGDQTLTYLFGVALIFLDTNAGIKEQRKTVQNRIDTVNLLRRQKKC